MAVHKCVSFALCFLGVFDFGGKLRPTEQTVGGFHVPLLR